MTSAARTAYNRAYKRAADARRTAMRLEAEAAVRLRRLEQETQQATTQEAACQTDQGETLRETLQVRMEVGAILKPVPPIPVPSRLAMLRRELRVLQHTYNQLLADHESAAQSA